MRTIVRFVFSVAVAAFAFAAAGPATAQQPTPASAANSIETFNTTTQGGVVYVKITMKEPLAAVPASFTVSNPARIAFDFPKTANALGRTSQDVNEGELRGMSVVQAGDRARLVLNLRQMVPYRAEIEGRNLIVALSPATAAAVQAATTGAPTRFAEGTTDTRHTVREIDFRRGKAGEGRVVVNLSDTSTGIDIRQQGQNLVVDFVKTALPDHLRARLDVVDFGTPVQNVNAFQQGENVRLVIEPKGQWEYNAYQTDTQFVVEVKPVAYDPNKLVQGSRGGYQGEKLSLNFQNIDVRSVLNVIADFTDLNIITSDSVQGNLTLRLKDVPWDQALDIILQTRGLDMRKNGNVLWIAPRDELATKEKLELEAKQQIAELEPLRTETFQLNYTRAEAFSKILTDDKQRILSKRGSAVWDPRTNQLFIQDIPSRLEDVRRIIAKTDIPVRQVMIDARIVEATDRFSRTLGFRLGYNDTTGQGSKLLGGPNRFLPGGGLAATGASTGQISGGTAPDFFRDSLSVNLPASATETNADRGKFSLILFNSAATKFLNLEITALESDGKGKVISSPRVVTADQVEAIIEQGTELPYQQSTSSGATSITFKKANLALKVKPQITPDGNVLMDVDVNKDSVGIQTAAGFAIDTKHVKTAVLVENGGTVVIGGIYTQEERSTINKVPLLGDLPGVGFMFRNRQNTDNKTELLFFLTPRIIDDRVSLR
ncbi:MAG: type IV pilus secretin PilQ [Burkholderiales bacterium]|jgi:type IV pilus assembly protein PilQ|nr:type IV pilus secretin PilQ [Burkholderiales bacterium]